MQSLARYRNSHAELTQMIEDLRSIMDLDQLKLRPTAKTAHELLSALAEKVKEHLAAEDKSLYPTLLIHEDPRVKSIAWGFISGEKPLRKSFDDFQRKWLKHPDYRFDEDFLGEARALFAMLTDRIEREQHLLFPKLLDIGVLEDTRAA